MKHWHNACNIASSQEMVARGSGCDRGNNSSGIRSDLRGMYDTQKS